VLHVVLNGRQHRDVGLLSGATQGVLLKNSGGILPLPRTADKLFVAGETPYAEFEADRPGGMGLDSTDLATLSRLEAAGVPLVVVLVSGRPLDVAAQLPDWDALVEAWLPSTEGQGVADVLFGGYNPTGRLPDTWMQSASQQPIRRRRRQAGAVPVRVRPELPLSAPPCADLLPHSRLTQTGQ